MNDEPDYEVVDRELLQAAELYEVYLEIAALAPVDFGQTEIAEERSATPVPLGFKLTPMPTGIVVS